MSPFTIAGEGYPYRELPRWTDPFETDKTIPCFGIVSQAVNRTVSTGLPRFRNRKPAR
jgi:hypothetical protein